MSMPLGTGSASQQQIHSSLVFTHPSSSREGCRNTRLCSLDAKQFSEIGGNMTPIKGMQEVQLCEHSHIRHLRPQDGYQDPL